ncbi:MAG: DNA repair protein RecO [Myxococcota bacterium]
MASRGKKNAVELNGILLTHRNFSDSHRIVEVLTAEEGRVSLLARGARASKKRFAGALDLFVSLRMQVSTGGNLWSLLSADIVNPRLGVRADLDAVLRASLLVELARTLAAENQPAPDLLSVLAEALDRVADGELASAAAAFPAMLSAAGMLPDVEVCVQCGERSCGGRVYDLGFVCERCRPGRRPISSEARAVWAGTPCVSNAVADEVEASVLDYAEEYLGARFRSRLKL